MRSTMFMENKRLGTMQLSAVALQEYSSNPSWHMFLCGISPLSQLPLSYRRGRSPVRGHGCCETHFFPPAPCQSFPISKFGCRVQAKKIPRMRESSAAPRCQLGLRWELPRCRLHQRYGHRRPTSRRPARIRRNARDREQRDEKESLVCTAVRSADTRGLCQARAGPCGRRTSRRVAEPRPASPSWARGVPASGPW